MRKTLVYSAFLLLVSFSVSIVHADRGMIPILHGVSVYEPGQKAIIAWNGSEEILILSTDVTSSNETLVLELLPLPSEPEVELASFNCFEEVQRLIWNEGINQLKYSTQNDARSGSVEVVFHENIGAHNLTVVKATNAEDLVVWMENFLETSNVNETISLGSFASAVENYMGRGFSYYALDLITVVPNERSLDPLLYRFNSSFLYYPLVITSPVPGSTKITLFLLTDGKVEKDYQPMQKTYYRVIGKSPTPIEFVLSRGDLSRIHLSFGELFNESAWLTVLDYEGQPSWLTRDLMIAEVADSATPVDVDVDVVLPLSMVASFVLLGAGCTLAGVVCTLLIVRPKKEHAKTANA